MDRLRKLEIFIDFTWEEKNPRIKILCALAPLKNANHKRNYLLGYVVLVIFSFSDYLLHVEVWND